MRGRKIDLVLAGLNGDPETDGIYLEALSRLLPQGANIAAFKHLCGEYHTASGFAMWLAAKILQGQRVPPALKLFSGVMPGEIRNILVYHHHKGERHSFILLSKPV